MSGEFRQYLFPHDHPRLAEVRGLDPYAYREHTRTPGTFTGGLVEGWTPLYLNEFRGVTEDGTLREGLYPLTPAEPGEQAPVAAMVAAAEDLLATGTPSGVGYGRTPQWLLQPGDVVEVEVERIGILTNTVVANSARKV